MKTQPEALRLAEWFEHIANGGEIVEIDGIARTNAAELRRLHQHELANIEWMEKTHWVLVDAQPIELGRHRADVIQMRVASLHALNSELLKALKLAVRQNSHDMLMTGEELRQCEITVAKAGGQP
jgi:hypothetical protein